ncbi:MAG: MBL fold metallo-hydrolase RNA specificity domain-containing protein, partial [Candidatus Hydrogenedentota bacterium]
GRTQELLNIIDRLINTGELPTVPVYASGLGRAIYEVYDKFNDFLKPEVSLSPLYQFKRIGDVWDPRVSRKLLKQPSIIVATSGMMVENTPSAMIAQEMVKEDNHGIFFVGYLDPDTLGYKLLNAELGQPLRFELEGQDTPVTLPNRQTFHFSAHAPREDLVHVVRQTQPRNVVFIHGEEDAIDWLKGACNGVANRFAPDIGETITLE